MTKKKSLTTNNYLRSKHCKKWYLLPSFYISKKIYHYSSR